MNYRIVRKMSAKTEVLSTEIEFGLALVKISCIEWSFGDSARATRALSEARNIHFAMAAIMDSTRGGRNLRRKFAKLTSLLKKVNQIMPDQNQVPVAADVLDFDGGRFRLPCVEARAMASAAS